MGKGGGKGGAQLGKTIKGRSKDKKRDKKDKIKDAAGADQMGEDIKMLEEYEKLNKLSEAQRIRLKVVDPSVFILFFWQLKYFSDEMFCRSNRNINSKKRTTQRLIRNC